MRLDIMESMKVRHSVRTYQKKEISEDMLQEIRSFLDLLQNKEQGKVKIKLVKQELGDKSVKLGTYGVIKGASYFFVAVCENTKEGYQNLGYVMEKAVLFCTSLGLGTCWIGGTFNKGNFAKVIELEENEVIAIVSPLGWEAEKNSWLGNIMSQKGKRKEFEVNFFSETPSTPLNRQAAGNYEPVLEMVRIAPSAVNAQPWRIVKCGSEFHFYIDSKRMMNQIDMGIAMCHFEEAAKANGITGQFVRKNPGIETNWEYIISWKENQ